MMNDFYSRSEALLGADTMQMLRTKRVILFGVGGVGSWAAECLIRTGLTHLTLVDGDTVQPSNLNRQLPATRDTLGMPKVEALKARLLTLNPEAEIVALQTMVNGEWLEANGLDGYDYLIDAIDSVNDKTDLILYASRVRAMKTYSSMGAALRFDPTAVTTGELMGIKGDALAKAVRARMKRLDRYPHKKIRCVYSTEQAQKCETRGSLMQVTAAFGLTLAGLVINDIKNTN
jgi:tRNA A37 threonylcarbamoyladenosine dehydratase